MEPLRKNSTGSTSLDEIDPTFDGLPGVLRARYADALTCRHPFSVRFHELLAELGRLHDLKQADYGKDEDPFANVRSSEEWGVAPWVGAMVRLNDKVKRLQSFVRNGSLNNEGVEDSLRDIAVYAVIALVLWEQGWE